MITIVTNLPLKQRTSNMLDQLEQLFHLRPVALRPNLAVNGIAQGQQQAVDVSSPVPETAVGLQAHTSSTTAPTACATVHLLTRQGSNLKQTGAFLRCTFSVQGMV